jgi:hypothetical protein
VSKDRAALAAVPEPEEPAEPGVMRLHLQGRFEGHWVDYRVRPTGREYIAFLRADEDQAGALEATAARVVRHSFGDGDIRDQDIGVLTHIIHEWTEREKKVALDPQNASG